MRNDPKLSKFDDASWHSGGDDFPEDLPEDNGATHIGFILTWLFEKGFLVELNEYWNGREDFMDEKWEEQYGWTGGLSKLKNVRGHGGHIV